jgi:hypothetical protein
MSALSDYAEKALLDHLLGTAAFTSPSTVYVGLATASDSTGSTLENLEQGILTNEVVGNGYTRQAATFDAVTLGAGSTSNSGNITFTASGGNWGEITTVFLIDTDSTSDSAGAGSILASGNITVPKDIQDGDSFQISTGSLTITLA